MTAKAYIWVVRVETNKRKENPDLPTQFFFPDMLIVTVKSVITLFPCSEADNLMYQFTVA